MRNINWNSQSECWNSRTHIAQLPFRVQAQISEEITEVLKEEGVFSKVELEKAMSSRLCDLEVILDLKEYEKTSFTMSMKP